MFSRLSNLVISVSRQRKTLSVQKLANGFKDFINSKGASRCYASNADSSSNGAIGADIDGDDDTMMLEDSDNEPSVAPNDIDAWDEDYDAKEGTVDEVREPEEEYPPIPQNRTGIYEFKGIKIMLPQKMLQNKATYRWRMERSDGRFTIGDDMRICNFEPKEEKEEH